MPAATGTPKTEDKPAPVGMGSVEMPAMSMPGMGMRSVETAGDAEVAGFDLQSVCDGPEPPEKVSTTLGKSLRYRW